MARGLSGVNGWRTLIETIEKIQAALDAYLIAYNSKRSHQGGDMNGRMPQQAFIEGLPKKTVRSQKKEEPNKPKAAWSSIPPGSATVKSIRIRQNPAIIRRFQF